MTTRSEPWPAGRILAWVALILYVATGFFPFLASGLVAPLWGIAVLWVGWLLGFWVTVGLVRRKSAWALVMPVVALAYWWLVITLGEVLFDWTA